MLDYRDRDRIIRGAMAEMEWPERDLPLLVWYFDRLGVNFFLEVWQDQSALNDSRPPRSKYRAFRARLAKAMPSSSSRSEFDSN